MVPWTLLPTVVPEAGEHALTHEAFCGVLAVTELDVTSPSGYLNKAVPFCNDSVWGTLSANILIHPKTEKTLGAEFDDALAALRYGTIGINAWAGLSYALVVSSWGAFPGHTMEDIRSGIGVVHNAFLLDHPEKSIFRAPFVIKPTPAWFADHSNLIELGVRLAEFETAPSWSKVPKVAIAALKG